MSAPDFAPIVAGEFVATWESFPAAAQFLGAGVWVRRAWVIRRGGEFYSIAETPGDVQTIIRFAQQPPRAA